MPAGSVELGWSDCFSRLPDRRCRGRSGIFCSEIPYRRNDIGARSAKYDFNGDAVSDGRLAIRLMHLPGVGWCPCFVMR